MIVRLGSNLSTLSTSLHHDPLLRPCDGFVATSEYPQISFHQRLMKAHLGSGLAAADAEHPCLESSIAERLHCRHLTGSAGLYRSRLAHPPRATTSAIAQLHAVVASGAASPRRSPRLVEISTRRKEYSKEQGSILDLLSFCIIRACTMQDVIVASLNRWSGKNHTRSPCMPSHYCMHDSKRGIEPCPEISASRRECLTTNSRPFEHRLIYSSHGTDPSFKTQAVLQTSMAQAQQYLPTYWYPLHPMHGCHSMQKAPFSWNSINTARSGTLPSSSPLRCKSQSVH